MTVESASSLPRGRVSFVITDIEGSTALLRRLGEDFRTLVVRHRELVVDAAGRHDGHLIGHEGDACFCVFAQAADAIAACVEVQAAIEAEPWPQDVQLAMRIGVHTGEAEPYCDSYISLAVHQTARVSAAGHGGQILISVATGEAAQGRMPDGCSLRDLGSFRLKDFPQPERLLQVCHPRLRVHFPQPRTLSARGHNLPPSGNSFIGRVDERARLGQLLGERRIVNVVGPGGVGKTRLALEVGSDVLPFFRDGVWLVELAAANDADSAARACAYALGVAEEGERPLIESVVAYLESRSVLLILDNCEHLPEIAGRIAGQLAMAPDVRILATSREPLYLSGEQLLRMAPLGTRDEGGELSEAARLLVERIQAHRADFVLDNRTAEAVGEICRRLDGMPLALELAASRARALPVGEIALRLKDRFRLLAGRTQDADSRHRTLRATVEWSYETLSLPERLLFDRLAVFADGWDLAAAEAVCSVDTLPVEDVADLLTALVDKSLVTYTLGFPASDDHRYGMLETLREFAAEKLRAGDAQAAQRGLLDWALSMAESAVPQFTGAEGPRWMQRLVIEQDNLRAALDVGHRLGAHDPTVRLTAALAHFWIKRGRLQEGADWAQRAEALPGVDRGARAQLLIAFGRLLRGSEPARAESLLREALGLAIEIDEVQTRLEALKQLTTCARDRGDYAAAEILLQEQAQILAGIDDPYRRFIVETELATLMLQQSRYAEAVPRLRERLAEAERRGWRFDRARLSNNLAVGLIEVGEYADALQLAMSGADIFRELGSLEGVAHVLSTAGLALLRSGDVTQARRNFVEVGRISLEVGASHLAPEALERLAAVELQSGGRERIAARYAYAADALYAAVGYEREPADKALRVELQARLDGCLDVHLLRTIQSDATVHARGILSEAVSAADL